MLHQSVLKFCLRASLLAAALGAAAPVAAQHPDYFPLHVGNQWVYRAGGSAPADPLVISITRGEVFDGRYYVELDAGRNGLFWVRQDADGQLWQWDPATRSEKLWYAFFAEPGKPYSTGLPYCCGTAEVASRTATLDSPVGALWPLLELRFPGVFQVGLDRELFLPYIGMVHRTENVGGPAVATYDLIYSRTGGVTQLEQPSIAFSLSLDRRLYTANLQPPVTPAAAVPVLNARLSFRNTHPQPLTLTFPSAQVFELVIRNAETNAIVYRWSARRIFGAVILQRPFSGETNWAVPVPLGDSLRGTPFAAGSYLAEAWLTTAASQPYRATVGFELRHVF